jgi:hypothetical protein
VRVRTDDEVYRVDAVWLGPPKATFPWRARYVAWGVGILVFLLTLSVERWIGFGFGFFTVAWGLVITIVLTRFICAKISHERPLTAVLTMWSSELRSPRERSTGRGGATSAARIRIRGQRPLPKHKHLAAPPGSRQTPAQRGQQTPTCGRAAPYAQNWSGRPEDTRGVPARTGERNVRRRSKEVGGVRTPGRK